MLNLWTAIATACLVVSLCAPQEMDNCPKGCQCKMLPETVVIMRCKSLTVENKLNVPVAHFEIVHSEHPITMKENVFAEIGLKHVNSIKISNSSISSINQLAFKQLAELSDVQITHTNISYIHPDIFQDNTNLKKITLAGNPLSGIESFLNSASVEELDISNCNLTKISPNTFKNVSQLTLLNLNGNNIKILAHDTFDYLIDIEEIRLGNNLISKLPEGMFAKNEELETLDLSNNPLTIFSGENLPNLLELTLQSCLLTTIDDSMFANMNDVTNLDVSSNKITIIDSKAFSQMPSLRSVNLSGNDLTSLNDHLFEYNTELIKIVLDNNKQLGLLPVGGFKSSSDFKVHYFSCNNCGLRSLSEKTFNSMANLVTVLLSNNKISDLSSGVFQALPELVDLDLSHNQISTIDDNTFKNNVHLHTLTLSGNPLKALHTSMFKHNPNLLNLDLSYCGLFKLWTLPATPEKLSSILSLNISNNKISIITDADIAVTNKLKTLDFSGNPTTCVESYKTFIEYLTKNAIQDTQWLTHENMVRNFKDHTSSMISWEDYAHAACPGLFLFNEKDENNPEYNDDNDTTQDGDYQYTDDGYPEDDPDYEENEKNKNELMSNPKKHSRDSIDLLNDPLYDQMGDDSSDVILLPIRPPRTRYSYMWPILVFIGTALAILGIVANAILFVIRRRQNMHIPRIHPIKSMSKLKKNSGLVYQQLSEERGGPKTPILSRYPAISSIYKTQSNAPESV